MIDNIEKIFNILTFDSEDDFYHVQILKRKKENPELGSNSYVVKTYYVSSKEYLVNKYSEMINLAELHNARVCINLNRRSFERIGFHLLRKVTEQIMNKDFKSIRKAYESVCGAHSNEKDKKWIIDIDEKEFDLLKISSVLENIEPLGNKVVTTLPTKNGWHLITSPFNIEKFKRDFSYDIHKDNPTILFVP